MKDFRHKIRGLADLLNYGFAIDKETIILKDGSFCGGWSYCGPDLFSCEESDQNYLRFGINNVFRQLGDGWLLHADMSRREISTYIENGSNDFPDATSFFLDQERREFFTSKNIHFENDFFFILTFKPPIELETKYKKMFLVDHGSVDDWNDLLKTFLTKLEQLENLLSKFLKIKRLKVNELLRHIHSCLTSKNHPIHISKTNMYLDLMLASEDFLGGFFPKIGTKNIALISINGFPLESNACMLKELCDLPIQFRWSNRFIFLDQYSANQLIKKTRKLWYQKKQGLSGIVREAFNLQNSIFYDQDALEMTNDADSALQVLESSLNHFGLYTSTLILMDDDINRLNTSKKVLIKLIENKGFSVRSESVNAVEAYLGSLPGHGFENIRKQIISTINLSDFLPLLNIATGLKNHPSPLYRNASPPLFLAQTNGGTPYHGCLHVNDVGHTLVLGDTGKGKSTLLGFLIAQHLRYPNAQVFMFDKGYSSFTLCHALLGDHYDVGNDSKLSFAPLKEINQTKELDWACEWLEILLGSQKLDISFLHRKEIRKCLERLSKQHSKTLTDLQASFQDKDLKSALELYTLTGTLGPLLDAEQDGISSSPLQLFEMQHLINKEEKFYLPVLDYLFHNINRRLDIQKPTLIIIEEGHHFLKGHFGKQLNTWLRETRKLNTAIIFVTQSLSEIVDSDHKHILLNSCPTKIFLPNHLANADYNRKLYHEVGLTDSQIKVITTAIPKQDYYFASPHGNQLLNLQLSRAFLSLMASTNQQERDRIIKLRQKYQEEWVYHFFQTKKLEKEATMWLKMYNNRTNGNENPIN
jgi:type IV secretion system protein VirB4